MKRLTNKDVRKARQLVKTDSPEAKRALRDLYRKAVAEIRQARRTFVDKLVEHGISRRRAIRMMRWGLDSR